MTNKDKLMVMYDKSITISRIATDTFKLMENSLNSPYESIREDAKGAVIDWTYVFNTSEEAVNMASDILNSDKRVSKNDIMMVGLYVKEYGDHLNYMDAVAKLKERANHYNEDKQEV